MNTNDTSRLRAESIVQGIVDGSRSADDKYDVAIEYLNALDCGQGGYMAEIATLMQELLGQVHELREAAAPASAPNGKPDESPAEASGRLSDAEVSFMNDHARYLTLVARRNKWLSAQGCSPAMEGSE